MSPAEILYLGLILETGQTGVFLAQEKLSAARDTLQLPDSLLLCESSVAGGRLLQFARPHSRHLQPNNTPIIGYISPVFGQTNLSVTEDKGVPGFVAQKSYSGYSL